MKYIKLFDNHSGYTEYIAGGEVAQPNVSHCVQENEVHYAPPQVLPGNEEAWELYSSLVCDDERLDEDLRNIFSKYEVIYSEQTVPVYDPMAEGKSRLYTDNGYVFSYRTPNMDFFEYYGCDIFTSRVAINSDYALTPVTNDCGMQVLPGENGVGQWEVRQKNFEPILDPIYTATT